MFLVVTNLANIIDAYGVKRDTYLELVCNVLGGGSGLMVKADDDQQDLVDGEEDQDASVESEDILPDGADAETGSMDAAATATDTDAEKVMFPIILFTSVS